jgi:DNA-binding GntR family transcriptional regulator
MVYDRSMQPAVKRSSLSSQIFDALRSRISSVEYLPGEKLDIAGLAAEFGVSTIPVREALKGLVERGLVALTPDVGYHIVDLTPSDVRWVFDLRCALELFGLEESLPLASEQTLDTLRERSLALLPWDGKAKSQSAFDAIDIALHKECVIGLASNPFLWDAYARLDDMIGITRHLYRRFEEGIQEHVALLEAITRRSLPNAREKLRAHLMKSAEECATGMAEFRATVLPREA